MSKFKVGDKVRIARKEESTAQWVKDMMKYLGEEGVVEDTTEGYNYNYRVKFNDEEWWLYSEACLELADSGLGESDWVTLSDPPTPEELPPFNELVYCHLKDGSYYEGHYDRIDKTGHVFLGFNINYLFLVKPLDVVAWTRMPVYEGAKDE